MAMINNATNLSELEAMLARWKAIDVNYPT